MSKSYVVAGAGFRGFCDAMELIKIPGAKVHIIDSAPFFGGLAYSREVNGFYVDKGVHMFDSIPQSLADIVNEIMDGKTKVIEFISQSAFNNVVTDGYSLPDLASLDEATKNKIREELLTLAANQDKAQTPKTLKDVFYTRFGKTAGDIYAGIFQKVYSMRADKVEPNGLSTTSLHRLKFLDDDDMLKLKADPWLDTVLAARRKSMGKIDDLVSIYPVDGNAMRGWCDRTVEWLKAKGVVISLGEKILSIKDAAQGVTVTTDKQVIEADQVIWSNDNVNGLGSAIGFSDDVKNYQFGAPMIFVTMMTHADKIKNFTYLQNFDLDARTYRTASAGIFSNQTKTDGTSFITSECPMVIGTEDWNNPQGFVAKAWRECKDLGIIAGDADLVGSEAICIPGTFKLPLLGYTQKVEEFHHELARHTQRVLLRNVVPFFRRDIYQDSLKLRDMVA